MLERLMFTLGHTGTDQYRQHLVQAMFALCLPFWELDKLQSDEKTGTMLINAELFLKIKMQTGHFKLKLISCKHSQG